MRLQELCHLYTQKLLELLQINTLFLKNPAYRNKSDYEFLYQAGGFWNVTIHCLSNGAIENPKEMANVMSAIMPSTIK